MIFTIPLTLLYLVFAGLLALLPTSVGLPSAIAISATYLFGFLWNLNYIIDIPTLIQVIGIQLGFEVAILLWHFIHWVIAKIPFLHVR